MNDVIELELGKFALVYVLLLIVIAIMKKSKINQTKLLIVASVKMTVQLILAGLLLTYIFDNPHWGFSLLYLLSMVIFAIHRVIKLNKKLNKRFKIIIGLSIGVSGFTMLFFFVGVVIGINVLNPQYAIPLGGMIIGNSLTGITLGLKSFNESISKQHVRIETLLNIGAAPKDILMPIVNTSLETALLPTLNSMLGMGIIALPGMMTGQILSGTLPTTAILYQIAIMITICTSVCLSVYLSLNMGYKTLFNKKNQIEY